MNSSTVTPYVVDVLVHYDNDPLTCLIKLCRQKKMKKCGKHIRVRKLSFYPPMHSYVPFANDIVFFSSCRRQNCSGVRGIWTWSRDQRCHVRGTRSQFTRHSLLYFLSQKTCKCLKLSSWSRSEGICYAPKAKQTYISKSVGWSFSNFMSSVSK